MEVGERIRELRHAKGLTLRQLADETQMSIGFLSDCENGRSNLSIASCQTIAAALGVTVSRLLGELPAEPLQIDGDAVTITWRCEDAGRLAELLRTFDDWRPADRAELLAYLTAKEAARKLKHRKKGR